MKLTPTRRKVLAVLGGSTAIGTAVANLERGTEGDGDLYGGKMALSEAFKFAEGPDGAVWIGPDSAKSNVSADDGNVPSLAV